MKTPLLLRYALGMRVLHKGLGLKGTVVQDVSLIGLDTTSTLVHFDEDDADDAREVTTSMLQPTD